jgi:hypothetical protein
VLKHAYLAIRGSPLFLRLRNRGCRWITEFEYKELNEIGGNLVTAILICLDNDGEQF